MVGCASFWHTVCDRLIGDNDVVVWLPSSDKRGASGGHIGWFSAVLVFDAHVDTVTVSTVENCTVG